MRFLVVFALVCSTAFALPKLTLDPSEKVQFGKAPFVASLQFCFYGICESDCTAVVINEKTLLTAANCAIENWHVAVGVTSLPNDNGAVQETTVASSIVHPDYNRVTSVNNIAVLKLVKPLELRNDTQALPLPKQGEAPTSDTVEVYGYPQRLAQSGSLLVAKNQKIISVEDCKSAIGKTTNDLNTSLCTASAASAEGDEGGPVVQNGVLIGITSFNTTDGIKKPGVLVFTPTNKYIEWIEQQLD